jgi:hypothetical protein
LRHFEHAELGSKLERQVRLQALDSARHVSDPEESLRINGLAPDVVAIHMRQTGARDIHARTRNDAVLDRDILVMVILNVARGLDFDETPAAVASPMQNVYLHEHAAVFEHGFKDRRDFWVCDQLSRCANRLIEIALADFYSTGKKLPGEHADLVSLLDNGLIGGTRLRCQLWRVDEQIQTLQTLHACTEFAFADSHAHRDASPSTKGFISARSYHAQVQLFRGVS